MLECNAISAAAAAGVEYIVKLSTASPIIAKGKEGQAAAHVAAEEALACSGVDYTSLRANYFMQVG